MLTDFYIAFGTVCFTLLGLWLVVVQTRHAEWRGVAVYRRRAYGVALHFFPARADEPAGLGEPRQHDAVAGVVCGRCRQRGDRAAIGSRVAARHGRPVAYLAAVVLYALIAVIAAVPSLVPDVGLSAPAVQVEAVLLTILVFFGVNVAWLLLFEEPQPPAPSHGSHADRR
jgi:hypothetical protein